MKTLASLSCLSLLLALPAHAQGKDVRIALVAGDKSEGVRNVVAISEAKLSQVPGVQLLERQAIDKVIAEQKLSLAGVVAADQVVVVGKLLTVDLFALVEAGTNPKEAGGLVIFDARTGVRLWDAALPSGELDRSVIAVADGVAAALRKRDAGGKLRPVCLMTVRNADLPRGWDGFCDGVGLLAERRLVESPDLAVLERRRLEQINKERNLPVDSPLSKLLASVVVVELEIGASADRKGLRATALLSDGTGKSLGKVTVTAPGRNAGLLSEAITKELARTLNAKAAPAVGGQEREAWRFIREADFWLEHRDCPRALRAAESASALLPEDPFAQAALARGLLRYGSDLLFAPTTSTTVKLETLEQSLALMRRGSDLLVVVESQRVAPDLAPQWENMLFFARAPLVGYIARIGALRTRISESEREALDAIRKNHNWSLNRQLEQTRQATKDRRSFDRHSMVLFRTLTSNADPFVAPTEWADVLCKLREWADLARQYEGEHAAMSRVVLATAASSYGQRRQLGEADAERLRKLWADLEGHPHPTIATYARLGAMAHDVTSGKLSVAETRARVRGFRLYLQGKIESRDTLSYFVRRNLYLAGVEAFSVSSALKLPDAVEEMRELCEFMLNRKEVLPPLVLECADYHFSRKRSEADHRFAYDLLRRALEIEEKQSGPFLCDIPTTATLATERANFRSAAGQLQARIVAKTPSAAPAIAVPWEKVTSLIDVHANNQGLMWLQRPIIHAGAVYVAGVRMDGRPARFSVQLMRLTPGQKEVWEGKPIEAPLAPDERGRPVLGPDRYNVLNGTTACVYENRYYLGTKENGIYIFPFNKGAPERISSADGLPSDAVQSLTCVDGRLFACLGDGRTESYIVGWDLKTRKCEILASSRRKEKLSPFDDSQPIIQSTIVPDPVRKRVLFVLFTNNVSAIDGVWFLRARSGGFQREVRLRGGEDSFLYGAGSRVDGDRLVLNGAMGTLEYNLYKAENQLLFDGKVMLNLKQPRPVTLQLEALPNYRISKQEFLNIRGPHLAVDGWVWGGFPFSRRRCADGKAEPLPPLRQGMKSFAVDQSLQRFSDRELLVGDSFGLWLVTLKKE